MNGITLKVGIIAALVLAELLLSSTAMAQRESDIAYRYRLFETTNIWTFILLDTATGRAWQVNYYLDDTPSVRSIINESSLLPEGVTRSNGRFTLYPTTNMYTFLLLDREDSRIWQLQWSLESKNRGIAGSIPLHR